jgi:hypothetical protein
MSKNQTQPQKQCSVFDATALVPPFCKVLLAAMIIWPVIAILATLVVIWWTKNALTVSLFPIFFAPFYGFYRLFNGLLLSLLPIHEKRFLLAQANIEALSMLRLFSKRDKSKG